MFFGHGIEKDPFSRVSLKNISFEPSRRPSGAGMLRYRDSFMAERADKFSKSLNVSYEILIKR